MMGTTKQVTDLFSSPFCAGKAVRSTVQDDLDPNNNGDAIICGTCGASTPLSLRDKGPKRVWGGSPISMHVWLGQAGLYFTRLDAVRNFEQSVTPISVDELFELASKLNEGRKTAGHNEVSI